MIALSSKVTLIIPTLNRSGFIARLLHYYETLSFQGPIFIADSSTSSHVELTRALVHRMKDKLRIVHREYPGLKNDGCFRSMCEMVSTPYVVFLGDDDFLAPSGLDQCIEFLENNSEYNAANGVSMIFSLDSSGPYGDLVGIGRYNGLRSIDGKSGAERLLAHLSNYSVVLFSVHRRITWLAMWRHEMPLEDLIFATELLPGSLSAIHGRAKTLDCLYLVRQEHPERFRHSDLLDWITGSNWPSSYQAFRNVLAEELIRQDGITLEEAYDVVKQAFWSYLANGLTSRWRGRYAENTGIFRGSLRQFARSIPGARRLWRRVRALRQNECDLSSLLRPSSPYHADFLPIYRAVTSPPKELTT